MRIITKGKKYSLITVVWFLALIVITLQRSSYGNVVTYTLNITSGGANTSGGFTGNGIGYLSLKGRFNLIIDYDSGLADLEDINISFSKPCTLNWSALKGTFNLGNLYLSSPNPLNDVNNYLSGTFNGSTAFLHGGLCDGFVDGFGYDCNFTAVVIPAIVSPSAVGEIVVWGYNYSGECDVPQPNTDFVAIAAGSNHSLGLKQNGSIVAWGYNYSGQCDVPSPNTGFKAIAAGSDHSLGLKTDGSIVAWGWNRFGQCDVPAPNTGFKAIAAGSDHSLGLKQNGSIVAWGWNGSGQCDVPAPNTGFKAIAAGYSHSLGLKQDGSIAAWGLNKDFMGNYKGQCDVPSPNTDFTAIAAGVWHSLGLKKDGSIVALGYNEYGQYNVPSPNTGFISIAAGWWHSLGLKQDGSVVVWGYNYSGEYSVPSPNTGFSSIAAGWGHSLGLKKVNAVTITRYTVTAGKDRWQDSFWASGTVELPADIDFDNINHINVNIFSLTDGASVYAETVDSSVVDGKFKYTYKIPKGRTGAITSLVLDSNKKIFSIKSQKVDLTGLSCPLQLKLTMSSPITGDHKFSGDADESIVNGTKKLIPTCLMRTHKNTLVVNKAKAKHSSKPISDTLSVTGDIAVENIDVNLCNYDVNFIWGYQKFRFPASSFKTSGTGHLFKGSVVVVYAGNSTGIITAQVDTDKATFTLSSKGVISIDNNWTSTPFGISFADFNEAVAVNRDSGRSW
jgi:hypothetical protein